MTTELFALLKQIYSSAGIPTVITDEAMNIIWRNSPAESEHGSLQNENVSFLFDGGTPVSGLVFFQDNDVIRRFNVLKSKNADDPAALYIIELIGSDDIKTLLASPHIKAYMTYLCARIRESVGMIAVSADEIDSVAAIFGADYGEVADQLNTINKGLMLILREVINPEHLYYVLDPGCDDVTICVADEIAQAVSDAKRSLGKTVRVSYTSEKGIYTRMNRSVFETIISDMALECCCGKLYPDELVFTCKRAVNPDPNVADKISITVKSLNRSGKENIPSKFERDKKGSKIYFDYLCSVLCEKYDAEFTRRELENGCSCCLILNSIGMDKRQIVMNGLRFSGRSDRFSIMTLSLAEHHLEERYRIVNIDSSAEAGGSDSPDC
ncbi:MAG: hypothetical protein NC395_09100 [Prevotella sp.]|nr:hypothetical protein [Prevotella sp.]